MDANEKIKQARKEGFYLNTWWTEKGPFVVEISWRQPGCRPPFNSIQGKIPLDEALETARKMRKAALENPCR